ncbi:MAG: hypothetical protein ABI760_21360 [Ferruginibacter sp.]
MSDSKLPAEVELVYDVMPCNAMRTAQEPLPGKHPCTYFRQWGTYHSFDYVMDGPPHVIGIPLEVKYVGRAALVPEILSGCRKAPIVAIGINPNLPGWFKSKKGSINPLFDDYKQYAHYFRYRSTYKLIISESDYKEYGGGDTDNPFSDFELKIPMDGQGNRKVTAKVDTQTMYTGYLGLLKEMAHKLGWDNSKLSLEEDFAYMNMVACPSAHWTTRTDPSDPQMPPMTIPQRNGIINECFHHRKHFFRQLFQSLPKVIMVFSDTTAQPFISEMQGNFTKGNPQPGEKVADLIGRNIRLRYGTLDDGTILDARVIFSPHISGNPATFAKLRSKVLKQLVNEARAGGLSFNTQTGHLRRPRGSCLFCPMLEIGPCPYENELRPVSLSPGLLADTAAPADVQMEKLAQQKLMEEFIKVRPSNSKAWKDEVDMSARV